MKFGTDEFEDMVKLNALLTNRMKTIGNAAAAISVSISVSICAMLALSSCNGAQSLQYASRSASSIEAADPLAMSATVLNLDASKTSQVSSSSGVTAWQDSISSTSTWSTGGSGLISIFSDNFKWLSLPANASLIGAGRLPDHLGDQFTFVIAASAFPDGTTLRFGVDDSTEAMILAASSGTLTLAHQTSATAYQKRIYRTQAPVQNSVITAVFGAQTKDIELYVDGVRLAPASTASLGSPTAYQAIARDFKLSVAPTATASAKIGRLLMFKGKLSPRPIYAISKFLSPSWGATLSTQAGSEAVNDILPTVEPDQIDSVFIYAAILTPKCLSCHQPGGITNIYFQTYSLLTTESGSRGRFVTPGSLALSRVYQAVLDESMPAGGASPLSTNEKASIKAWIEAGAPQ